MSLYNVLFDEDENADVLIGVLNLNKAIFERYRDVHLNAAGDKIIVYTRCGGGNRTACDRVFEIMKRHPNYLRDYDDSHDSTYAYIEFSVPEKYKELCQKIKPEKDPLTVWEKFEQHIEKAKLDPDGPEAQKDNIVAKKILDAMENGKPGLNIIGI